VNISEYEDHYRGRAEHRELPDYMIDGLVRYIVHGMEPGSFMTAVLENDLAWAAARADAVNRHNLFKYASFLLYDAPNGCWGSKSKVREWIEKGGLSSLQGSSVWTPKNKDKVEIQ
jgi:hypothetical protein